MKAPKKFSKLGKQRYVSHDPKADMYVVVSGSRPNNQNQKGVQRKTATRLKKLPKAMLRPTTSDFVASHAKGVPLSKMDGGAGLNMAHGVSIAELKQTTVELVNVSAKLKPSDTKKRKLMIDFAPDFVTTDASDIDDVRKASKEMFHPKTKAARKLTIIRMLLRRLNKTSGNFAGGNAVLNSLVSSRRDIPTTKDNKPFPHVAKRMKLVDELVKVYKLDHSQYAPMMSKGKPVSSTL